MKIAETLELKLSTCIDVWWNHASTSESIKWHNAREQAVNVSAAIECIGHSFIFINDFGGRVRMCPFWCATSEMESKNSHRFCAFGWKHIDELAAFILLSRLSWCRLSGHTAWPNGASQLDCQTFKITTATVKWSACSELLGMRCCVVWRKFPSNISVMAFMAVMQKKH